MKLKLFSGECVLCDIGIDTANYDHEGVPLFTGDIVLLYNVMWPGTDQEHWYPHGLTAVSYNQYRSYSDGTVRLIDDVTEFPFVMGIKGVGFTNPNWRIIRVKSHTDVIDGEHWREYGFRYGYSEAADKAKEAHNVP